MASTRTIAEVALLQRLPRAASVFDYLAPDSLKGLQAGDLVNVPFRTRQTLGVVVRLKSRSAVKGSLKQIATRPAAQLVTGPQLELTKHVAAHYGVAWGSALRLALPVLPNKRFAPGMAARQTAVRRSKVTPVNLIFNTETQHQAAVLALAQRLMRRRQVLLLIVPELVYLKRWQERLRHHGLPSVMYSAEMKTTAQREAWLAVRGGQALVVVSTRAGLFLPFQNLGGVVVDYADSEHYKQADQNPRYDGLEVVRWLAELHRASLALVSPAPRLEQWYEAQRGTATWKSLGGATPATLTVVDVAVARQAGSKSVLSPELTDTIAQTLKRSGRAFLYLNRRGTATSVLCRDCGYVPTCPNCQRPLVWDAPHNQLTCFHCGVIAAIPVPCPRCRGLNVRYLGTGLTKVAQEVEHAWPTIKCLTIEGEGAHPNADELSRADIIIGSRAAWRHLDFSNFNLIGLVLPDIELSIPEFRASEEVLQTARFFLTCGAGQVVAQTYRPDHAVWRSLATRWQNFYPEELENRAKYHYPPLWQLLRLTCEGVDERGTLKHARELKALVQEHLPKIVALNGPYPDYYRLVRGRYRFHLLLRYPSRGFNPQSLWPVLPDEVLVDRHPWSILN